MHRADIHELLKRKHHPLSTARRVIRDNIAALNLLLSMMDINFQKAVDMILRCRGRVVCSGMGKAGNIARKVAATMSSTGTHAYFVHPGDASHGDLGMISRDDTILLFSKSGETQELSCIIQYAHRFSINLICITCNKNSSLCTGSDICLLLPEVREACAVGMAPTTSSVLMMVLGDALAVALMECRDFTAESFRSFHPGGKLGQQLLKVGDLMHVGSYVPLVDSNTPMQDVISVITSKGFGITGVVNVEENLTGVITDGDLRRNIEGILDKKACDVAGENPKVMTREETVAGALDMMHNNKITCVFVVRYQHHKMIPEGILHMHDCLRVGLL